MNFDPRYFKDLNDLSPEGKKDLSALMSEQTKPGNTTPRELYVFPVYRTIKDYMRYVFEYTINKIIDGFVDNRQYCEIVRLGHTGDFGHFFIEDHVKFMEIDVNDHCKTTPVYDIKLCRKLDEDEWIIRVEHGYCLKFTLRCEKIYENAWPPVSYDMKMDADMDMTDDDSDTKSLRDDLINAYANMYLHDCILSGVEIKWQYGNVHETDTECLQAFGWKHKPSNDEGCVV